MENYSIKINDREYRICKCILGENVIYLWRINPVYVSAFNYLTLIGKFKIKNNVNI